LGGQGQGLDWTGLDWTIVVVVLRNFGRGIKMKNVTGIAGSCTESRNCARHEGAAPDLLSLLFTKWMVVGVGRI
jgi:hypothetical protein